MLSLVLIVSVFGAIVVAAGLAIVQIVIESHNPAKLRRMKYVKSKNWVECAPLADPQAYHLLLKMLQKKPAERIEAALLLKHSYLAGGVDTVEMEASFGPMQKGNLFLRSLLNQMRQPKPAR